jgi:AAA ATPase domain
MPDTASFCNRCGTKLGTPTQANSSTSNPGPGGKLTGHAITEKSYPWRIDSDSLVRVLLRSFRGEGYDVSRRIETNLKESESLSCQVVEITKTGWRTILGINEGLVIRIQLLENSTVITLGKRRGTEVFFPAAILPAVGYLEQRKLPSKIWKVIEEYLESSRKEGLASGSVRVIHRFDTGDSFIGRLSELEKFKTSIENILNGRAPRYLALSGEAGIGKSALLREYDKIASERGFLVVRREFDASLHSIGEAILFLKDAFNRESMVRLSPLEKSVRKLGRELDDHGLNVGGYGFSARPRTVSPEVLQENSFELLQSRTKKLIQRGIPGVVFLLDDADRLNEIDGGWAFLRTLFQRLNENGNYFMLVVAGSRLFKKGKFESQSFRRFFDKLELRSFSQDETAFFIKQLFENTGITFSDGAIQNIYKLSLGHPVILQVFASELAEAQNNAGNIDESNVKRLVPSVISKLGEGFFSENFEEATEQERAVLEVMSMAKKPLNIDRVNSLLRNNQMDVKLVLKSLLEKGCVRIDLEGRYTLFNPLFAQYVRNNSEISVEA